MAHQINNIIYDFTINEKIYNDIKADATKHKTSITQEMNSRIKHTLNQDYRYGDNWKVRFHASNACDYSNPKNKFKTFPFTITKHLTDVINVIQLHRPNVDELVYEMCLRIAYTIYDPFYEDYYEKNK